MALGGAARYGRSGAFAEGARARDEPGIRRVAQARVSAARRRARLDAAVGSSANGAAPGKVLVEQRSEMARAGAVVMERWS